MLVLAIAIIVALIGWFELIDTIVEENSYLPLAMFTAGAMFGVGVIVCIGILTDV